MKKLTIDEARKEWVKALKSGKYQQVEGYLCYREAGIDKYCCLGVACELYNEFNKPLEITELTPFHSPIFDIEKKKDVYKMYSGESMNLPEPVQKWLGIDHIGSLSCSIKGTDQVNRTCLAQLNDSGLYSFNDIATIIEENKLESVS